jgi:hypothetical protein
MNDKRKALPKCPNPNCDGREFSVGVLKLRHHPTGALTKVIFCDKCGTIIDHLDRYFKECEFDERLSKSPFFTSSSFQTKSRQVVLGDSGSLDRQTALVFSLPE